MVESQTPELLAGLGPKALKYFGWEMIDNKSFNVQGHYDKKQSQMSLTPELSSYAPIDTNHNNRYNPHSNLHVIDE